MREPHPIPAYAPSEQRRSVINLSCGLGPGEDTSWLVTNRTRVDHNVGADGVEPGGGVFFDVRSVCLPGVERHEAGMSCRVVATTLGVDNEDTLEIPLAIHFLQRDADEAAAEGLIHYMSPEQAGWAIGTTYELLDGVNRIWQQANIRFLWQSMTVGGPRFDDVGELESPPVAPEDRERPLFRAGPFNLFANSCQEGFDQSVPPIPSWQEPGLIHVFVFNKNEPDAGRFGQAWVGCGVVFMPRVEFRLTGNANRNGQRMRVFAHELGHALGLVHPRGADLERAPEQAEDSPGNRLDLSNNLMTGTNRSPFTWNRLVAGQIAAARKVARNLVGTTCDSAVWQERAGSPFRGDGHFGPNLGGCEVACNPC